MTQGRLWKEQKYWSPLKKRATKTTGGTYEFALDRKTIIKLGEWALKPNSPTAELHIWARDGRDHTLLITLNSY